MAPQGQAESATPHLFADLRVCSSHFRLRIGLGDADLAIQSASAHSLTSSIMARVYVGNLDPGTEKEELKDAFEKHGRLADVWIARNPPGFAFIVRR